MSSYIDRDPIVKFLTEKINDTETSTMLGRGYKMGLQFARAAIELAAEVEMESEDEQVHRCRRTKKRFYELERNR